MVESLQEYRSKLEEMNTEQLGVELHKVTGGHKRDETTLSKEAVIAQFVLDKLIDLEYEEMEGRD